MAEPTPPAPEEAITRLRESAQRLGIHMDEHDAAEWLAAINAPSSADEVVMDEKHGVFGHRTTMLDFNAADLARFREVGKIVEFADEPGVVETALALSGSAAQSKIQTYPGDCDFFERVNIIAPTREGACQILARLMRDKALATLKGPSYQLIEVKFGAYPANVTVGEQLIKKGTPISWRPAQIAAGFIDVIHADGSAGQVRWEDAARDPGWCKLDWVVADSNRGRLANASNMLDVTWEGPDGKLVPLDGYLDGYFQEVYLDAASMPIFNKLVKQVSGDAMDDYVTSLTKEVKKYLGTKSANYGKAAKRMYNIFRLTGRYEEAAFLREIFDEPTNMLYQVWSLLKTIEEAFGPEASIPLADVLAQTDQLILNVITALEGPKEQEIVRYLLRLKDALMHQKVGEGLTAQVDTARAEVMNLVNNFFFDKLSAFAPIKAYMDDIGAAPQAST